MKWVWGYMQGGQWLKLEQSECWSELRNDLRVRLKRVQESIKDDCRNVHGCSGKVFWSVPGYWDGSDYVISMPDVRWSGDFKQGPKHYWEAHDWRGWYPLSPLCGSTLCPQQPCVLNMLRILFRHSENGSVWKGEWGIHWRLWRVKILISWQPFQAARIKIIFHPMNLYQRIYCN